MNLSFQLLQQPHCGQKRRILSSQYRNWANFGYFARLLANLVFVIVKKNYNYSEMRVNVNVWPLIDHYWKIITFEAFFKILFETPGDNLLNKLMIFLLYGIFTSLTSIVVFAQWIWILFRGFEQASLSQTAVVLTVSPIQSIEPMGQFLAISAVNNGSAILIWLLPAITDKDFISVIFIPLLSFIFCWCIFVPSSSTRRLLLHLKLT